MMFGRALLESISLEARRRKRSSCRRHLEDLERRRDDIILAQLAKRNEPRVLRVRRRERIPPKVFAKDIDQNVVPADLAVLPFDEVADVEDAQGLHVDPGLLASLPDRSRLDRLTDLQGPARQAPTAAVGLGAPFHKEHRAIPEYDRADGGHGALREFVLG